MILSSILALPYQLYVTIQFTPESLPPLWYWVQYWHYHINCMYVTIQYTPESLPQLWYWVQYWYYNIRCVLQYGIYKNPYLHFDTESNTGTTISIVCFTTVYTRILTSTMILSPILLLPYQLYATIQYTSESLPPLWYWVQYWQYLINCMLHYSIHQNPYLHYDTESNTVTIISIVCYNTVHTRILTSTMILSSILALTYQLYVTIQYTTESLPPLWYWVQYWQYLNHCMLQYSTHQNSYLHCDF